MSKQGSNSASRAACALVASALVVSANAGDLVGRWMPPDGESIIEIQPCGAERCGSIVWLKKPADPSGKPWTDTENPDPPLRSRGLAGLRILSGLKPDGPGEWSGGSIYDPNSGKTYSCKASLAVDGGLELRGYFMTPLLGRTEKWKRVAEPR
ncbi:MAG: DUF2147 domain-containing protein [Fibrobacteria bacterium]|nr:DUF2147 domain-containing protein [Fibrobacteria bacterium]